LPIVSFYAALFGLLFATLSIRTLRLRRRLRIAVGDAGDLTLLRAMRVHANFAEYVPLTLLLIWFVEVGGAHRLFVHALCAGLLAGRIAHAIGVSRVNERYGWRVLGMALTLTPLIAAAIGLLVLHAAYRGA
jgi:hypothetical protein